jgi:hypothetical protein
VPVAPPAAATALMKNSPNPLMLVTLVVVVVAFLGDLFVGSSMVRQNLLNY